LPGFILLLKLSTKAESYSPGWICSLAELPKNYNTASLRLYFAKPQGVYKMVNIVPGNKKPEHASLLWFCRCGMTCNILVSLMKKQKSGVYINIEFFFSCEYRFPKHRILAAADWLGETPRRNQT